MIKIEYLIENKNTIDESANQLNTNDIEYLINLLNEKNNEVRYTAFLVLQSRSQMFSDVYKYWQDFCKKLSNSNSYQRSIGIMFIAENNRWDDQNKFEDIIDMYLSIVRMRNLLLQDKQFKVLINGLCIKKAYYH